MRQSMLRRLLFSPHVIGGLVSLFAFGVYLRTLAPTVNFIDSGELAAVACTLGIAHPTGYPLFTLLGWIFSKLPVGSEEIVRLNVMAAFLCAAGVLVFFHAVRLVLNTAASRAAWLRFKNEELTVHGVTVSSAGAALLLAFSRTYWSQATSIEVYSLHVLILALVLFSFLRATFSSALAREEGREVWWFLFAFFLGLSFTNHMTTILLGPGLLFLYFATQGSTGRSWKRIGLMVFPFLLGLSVYAYLVLRAAQGPALNWGNPATLERLSWHLSGKQYRVWIFSSTEAAGRQFRYFLDVLPSEFAVVGLLLAIIGVFALWKAYRKLALGVLLLFVSCVLYSINYDIHDIDSYFLLAYVSVAILAGAGLLVLSSFLAGKARLSMPVVTTLLIAASLIPLVTHYHRSDESKNYLVEDYTHNVFASLQPNALVFSFQWDFWVSASYYYQFVKGVRTDVTVVDKELLRRSWYFVQLERYAPWLIHESRAEVNAFLKELHKFEHDLPYDPAVIQARFVEMIQSFLRRSMKDRPVYVTSEIEAEFTGGLQRVPAGLAQRLYADTLYHAESHPTFAYRPLGRTGRLEDFTRQLYVRALSARALYAYYRGQNEAEAEKALRTALSFDPTSPEVRTLLARIAPGNRQ